MAKTKQHRGTHPLSKRKPKPKKRPGAAVAAVLAVAVAVAVGISLLLTRSGRESAAGDRPFVGGDLHSLVADARSGRLYVGGHEGVAVSRDEGATWSQIDSLDDADAMGWGLTGGRIFVGGHPGLSVSSDGTNFQQANDGLPATDLHALGAGEDIIFAASPAAGVFASTDGGASWQMRSTQAGQSFMGSILVDPNNPEHLIAPDMQAGAASSTDGGETWSALGGPPAMWVSWDPKDTSHIIVSGMSGTEETTDGGETWASLQTPAGASAVELDARNPKTMYAAGLEGSNAQIWKSTDGGKTWVES